MKNHLREAERARGDGPNLIDHEPAGRCVHQVKDIIEGRGQIGDLEYLQELGTTIKLTSRCGLGQTAANPVLTTIQAFRPAYEALLRKRPDEPCLASFDIRAALEDSERLMGRTSEVFAG